MSDVDIDTDNEDKMKDDDRLLKIESGIITLEKRVIDLIVPIQNIAQCLKSTTDIQYLIDALKGPIPVNTVHLKSLLLDFQSEMRAFDKNVDKMESIQKEYASVGEIKYIGNRLNEIEKILKKLMEDQPKKEVQIQFSCDGYELVKKPMHYDNTAPVEPVKDPVGDLLKTLSERETKVLIRRFCSLNKQTPSYREIAIKFNITGSRVEQICNKALRKCRNKTRQHLVQQLPKGKLRNAILGEDS